MGQNRTNDPQLKVRGFLKVKADGGELITFKIHLALFEMVCIVNIPDTDQSEAPVYVKFKIKTPDQIEEYYNPSNRGVRNGGRKDSTSEASTEEEEDHE